MVKQHRRAMCMFHDKRESIDGKYSHAYGYNPL
jgi:hypothetical protein